MKKIIIISMFIFIEFQRKVLIALETLVERQTDIVSTQQSILASVSPLDSSEIEDIVEKPMQTEEEVLELCKQIESDRGFRNKLVSSVAMCLIFGEYSSSWICLRAQ